MPRTGYEPAMQAFERRNSVCTLYRWATLLDMYQTSDRVRPVDCLFICILIRCARPSRGLHVPCDGQISHPSDEPEPWRPGQVAVAKQLRSGALIN
jgi:hypothetical protein